MKSRLAKPEARSAILAWAVEGCIAWQRDGLGEVPRIALDALAEYRTDSDPWTRFLEEMTVGHDEGFVTKDDMFSAYLRWAGGESMHRTTTKNKLGTILKERGVQDHAREVSRGGKRTSERGWRGVSLKPSGITIQGKEIP